MDIIRSYDELAGFFAGSGLQHQAEPGQSLIKVPTHKGPLDGVLFIRWEASQQVVHFIQTLDFAIPPERLPAVALAAAILNHALPIPGFGINAGLGNAYFRITMPLRPEGTIAKAEVQGLFNLVVRTASEHLGALREVAVSGADPMAILAATQAGPPAN